VSPDQVDDFIIVMFLNWFARYLRRKEGKKVVVYLLDPSDELPDVRVRVYVQSDADTSSVALPPRRKHVFGHASMARLKLLTV
jgi:hypothetical protein